MTGITTAALTSARSKQTAVKNTDAPCATNGIRTKKEDF